MAAGTDITHPVSALDGVYTSQPVETTPVGTPKENGVALDSQELAPVEPLRNDRDVGSNRPPRPVALVDPPAPAHRRSISSVVTSASSSSHTVESRVDRVLNESIKEYVPELRSGCWVDIGVRQTMEDTHMRIDDLEQHARELAFSCEIPGAFYGVFDGHGGTEAASFVREHLLTNILGDVAFPTSMDDAFKNAFLQTDLAFFDEDDSSGTTALAAMVFGRSLVVANVGDCRAVLSKRGKAVNMSTDHKPELEVEKARIEAAGGYVNDGYLNGHFNVSRAIGDWRIVGVKEAGIGGPLTAEPEVKRATLTEEDEFLIIGCDGLWDVFTSQSAVNFARGRLQEHNDPERCSRELVMEALDRHTSDNLTVVTVCFQPNPPPRPTGWVPRFRRSISAEGLRNLQDLIDGNPRP